MGGLGNNKTKQIIASIAIICFVGLLIYLLGNKNTLSNSVPYFGKNTVSTTTDPDIQIENNGVAKIYKDTNFGFSIRIPKEAKTTSFQDGGGNTLLVQSNKYQMQIYVSNFDENIGLTIARIKKDIPDIKMENPMEIETAGTPTVAFISHDRGAPYREIWFVNKGYLYQVLAPEGEDPMTATIMQSWVWN